MEVMVFTGAVQWLRVLYMVGYWHDCRIVELVRIYST